MEYNLELSQNTVNILNKIKKKDKHNFDIVIKHLTNLETNPKYYGKPLKERLSSLWSYRIGNFRIIYEIQKTTNNIYNHNGSQEKCI